MGRRDPNKEANELFAGVCVHTSYAPAVVINRVADRGLQPRRRESR
jgi:hypothetical protein